MEASTARWTRCKYLMPFSSAVVWHETRNAGQMWPRAEIFRIHLTRQPCDERVRRASLGTPGDRWPARWVRAWRAVLPSGPVMERGGPMDWTRTRKALAFCLAVFGGGTVFCGPAAAQPVDEIWNDRFP